MRRHALIIDGYNIIGQMKGGTTSLEHARDRLALLVADYAGYTGTRCIIVFDGYNVPGNRGDEYEQAGIGIVFTRQDETADVYIERFTKQLIADRWEVTVATGDAVEQGMILGMGAYRMSAREFLREMAEVRAGRRKEHAAEEPPSYIFSGLDRKTLEKLERMRKGEKE